MVCCQDQNSCPGFISCSGARVIMGMQVWFFLFLYSGFLLLISHFDNSLLLRRILYPKTWRRYTNMPGLLPLPGCGWCWPRSFHCNSATWRPCHWWCGFVVGSGSIQEERTFKGCIQLPPMIPALQFYRRHSKADFHDKYRKYSSETIQPSPISKPYAKLRVLKPLRTKISRNFKNALLFEITELLWLT